MNQLTQQTIIQTLDAWSKNMQNHAWHQELQEVITTACNQNLWFTHASCMLSLNYWTAMLQEKKLEAFCANYPSIASPKNIGIVMAGNIPLVGFHDLLCVLLAGHKAIIKPATEDTILLTWMLHKFGEIQPSLLDSIQIVERLKNTDAVIATGSNNSFRYFEYYFRDIPKLLRKNRKSVAILSGAESKEKLSLLGNDIFTYYGLGCRNISLVFVPQNFDITKLLDALEPYKEVINHNRYANNYTYNKAIFLMNNEPHLDTDYLLVRKNNSLNTPLGCLHYFQYTDKQEITNYLSIYQEDIQIVVSDFWENAIAIGQSQMPALHDYADNVDTMAFLTRDL